MSDFYCPYWNNPLSKATDTEQAQCFALGKNCEACMEDAEDDSYDE